MAVEIIERGQLPSETVYDATCGNCRTKIRFKRGDAKYFFDQRDGDFLSIACPVCSFVIYKDVRK